MDLGCSRIQEERRSGRQEVEALYVLGLAPICYLGLPPIVKPYTKSSVCTYIFGIDKIEVASIAEVPDILCSKQQHWL